MFFFCCVIAYLHCSVVSPALRKPVETDCEWTTAIPFKVGQSLAYLQKVVFTINQ
jgi:hypothetical protein